MNRNGPFDIEEENRRWNRDRRFTTIATYSFVGVLLTTAAIDVAARRARDGNAPVFSDVNGDGIDDKVWSIPQENTLYALERAGIIRPRVEFGVRQADGSVEYLAYDQIAELFLSEADKRISTYGSR